MRDKLYRNQTEKKPARLAEDLQKIVQRHGFIIHNENTMAMARTFGKHGAVVAEKFDLQ